MDIAAMFKRKIEEYLDKYLKSEEKKSLFIWGPRRSGKTTLIEKLAGELGVRIYNFDLESDREKFAPRREVLEKLVRENVTTALPKSQSIILIDEVQNFPEATVVIKLLHDEYGTKVVATGSSELRRKSKQFDSLAGRFNEIYCLPFSISEILDNEKPRADEETEFKKQLLKKVQIFGSYPEVYTKEDLSGEERINLLQRILDTYVLKDIIDIYDLKDTRLAKDILTKIALQLGSEVSIREIANSLGAFASTVSNYIEIFIKNYILIPLPSFKTNIRKAVSENRKLYFYDFGIRNILIQDFRDPELRQDKGGVFENFIILEIEKQRRNTGALRNLYFYREYGGKEIDVIIEDYKKNYTALEIKIDKGKTKDIFPLPHKAETINTQNYFEVISKILG